MWGGRGGGGGQSKIFPFRADFFSEEWQNNTVAPLNVRQSPSERRTILKKKKEIVYSFALKAFIPFSICKGFPFTRKRFLLQAVVKTISAAASIESVNILLNQRIQRN